MQSKVMNRLQLVVYPPRDVLLGWKQIGGVLFEENPMFLPELCYEANESASERAEGSGRRTLPLHVSPVNLDAHVVVAPGIPCMCQAIASMRTSPVPSIPISGTLLLQILACILHQDLLRVVGGGKDSNIYDSHQLLVEGIILVSVVLSIKILDVRSVGSSNAHMNCFCQVHIGF